MSGPAPTWPDDRLGEVQTLLDDGLTHAMIAAKLKTTRSSVSSAIRRLKNPSASARVGIPHARGACWDDKVFEPYEVTKARLKAQRRRAAAREDRP